MKSDARFRLWAHLIAIGATILVAAAGAIFLGPKDRIAVLLLDRGGATYPVTIQTIELLAFCLGLAELSCRVRWVRREADYLRRGLLPEDPACVLELKDIADINARFSSEATSRQAVLPTLIVECNTHLLATRSIDRSAAMLSAQSDLLETRVDLAYQYLRYISWVIPTLGFIGTVMGISGGLQVLARQGAKLDIGPVVKMLAFSFDTTLVALIYSAILLLLIHAVQEREEGTVAESVSYVLKNLINRVYIRV